MVGILFRDSISAEKMIFLVGIFGVTEGESILPISKGPFLRFKVRFLVAEIKTDCLKEKSKSSQIRKIFAKTKNLENPLLKRASISVITIKIDIEQIYRFNLKNLRKV